MLFDNVTLSSTETNTTVLTTTLENNLTVSQLQSSVLEDINKYTTPVLYFIGFPGNVVSLIVWMQKRMRHSSGYYLAALALDDLIFLALHLVYELQETWKFKLLNFQYVCETYPVIYLSSQYLSPFLVLAFTTERYISICHPFKREKFCTIRRAKIVIISLAAFMFCLSAAHGYFWYLKNGDCTTRDEVTKGGTKSVFNVYGAAVDLLAFFVVPITVLTLNVLVIREMRKLSRTEQSQLHGSSQRTGSTTVMLLAVSFYQIITTLPVSIVNALYSEFTCIPEMATECQTPQKLERFDVYNWFRTIIYEYGITHYAFNIFIYLITGKMFREELKKLIWRPFAKLASSFPTDYASLRTTVRGSERSRTWVSVKGNNNSDRAPDETLL